MQAFFFDPGLARPFNAIDQPCAHKPFRQMMSKAANLKSKFSRQVAAVARRSPVGTPWFEFHGNSVLIFGQRPGRSPPQQVVCSRAAFIVRMSAAGCQSRFTMHGLHVHVKLSLQ